MLQSEVGYIDATPKTRSTKLLATHGGITIVHRSLVYECERHASIALAFRVL